MEEHRLEGIDIFINNKYDEALFKELYSNTEKLRNKLAYGIDPHRLGVEPEDLKSWFDSKFIYAFCKYQHKEPEILKAYILNSLSNFKYRILRKGYSKKNEALMNKVDINEYFKQDEIVETGTYKQDDRLGGVMSFLKDHLSKGAYDFLLVDLYTPPYIMHRLQSETTGDEKKLPKVSKALYAEFLGVEEVAIEKYQREIRKAKKSARVSLN